DLKLLRQWDSRTPGHPEHGHTIGVETTTGPLGQGVGNAVGMAMAQRYERGLYDPQAKPGRSVFDHTIWCFASDGDIEEGISGKAHGSALGADEVRATKEILGFPPDASFYCPDDVLAHTRQVVDRGREAHEKWQKDFDAWASANPDRATELDRISHRRLPEGWD